MSGKCEQDDNYWCPLASDDCKNIPKPCVLLVSTHGSSQTLVQLGLVYEMKDGKFVLTEKRQRFE